LLCGGWAAGGEALGLNTLARAQTGGLLHYLREENSSRITWLLNLTSDVEIPCVAALSASVEVAGSPAELRRDWM